MRIAYAAALAAAVSFVISGVMLGGCASPDRGGAKSAAHEAAAPSPLASVAFIGGHWKGAHDGGTWEELWTTDEGGMMAGSAKMVVGGRCVFFEHSRIMTGRDGKVVLLVAPGGRHPPTVFPLEFSSNENGVKTATFHKPDHDYPRKIRYVRSAEGRVTKLEAFLEGEENSAAKSEKISMMRVEQ
ncbi:MAG: DUF6265 family protein [Phycisphaerales bacterium]